MAEARKLDGVLILSNPIEVNGSTIKTLEYDANEITGTMFAEAQAVRDRTGGSKSVSVLLETDHSMHLHLGFAAIIAKNSKVDFSDLNRMKGADIMKVQRIGRNFIFSGLEEPSSPDSSEDSTGNTGEPSTPPKENSRKGA